VRVKPNLPVLGPKLGKELGSIRAALQAGDFEQLEGGGVRVNGRDLGADEVLVERSAREGWALAEDGSLTVAVTTALDDELRLEARVLDLIHQLNTMRKDAGLALTDRIRVTLPEADADLLEHEAWIKEEVLATEIRTDGVAEPQIAKI
jgi:isoleucyl-tRNA synthetase